MRLSPCDFSALQHAILALRAHLDLEAFRQATPEIFTRIIPADYFALTEAGLDPATQKTSLVERWESSHRLTDEVVARMERFGFDHPFTQYSRRTADPTSLKLSDFFTWPRLESSALYQEFYRHAGVGRLLGVAMFSGRGMATLNLARAPRERDFGERDRLLLNLLRPHFAQARRNAERYTSRFHEPAPPIEVDRLTPRETEVARWLAKGRTNAQIASALGVEARTVEKHMDHILAKLGVENRTTAALILARGFEATTPAAATERNGSRA